MPVLNGNGDKMAANDSQGGGDLYDFTELIVARIVHAYLRIYAYKVFI